MQTRVVSSKAALQALLPEWVRLFEADPRRNARNAPHLHLGFHRFFRPDTVARVIVVSDDHGTLCGVLPLGLQRQRVGVIAIRKLVALTDWHAYFLDATVDPEQSAPVCSALGRALAQMQWDRLELRHLRPDSWLLDPAGVLNEVVDARRAEGLPAPRVSLPRAVVLGGRSGADMQRREQALHATGNISTGWEPPGPAFQATIAEFIALHTALKGLQRQTATFQYGGAAADFPAWLESEVRAGRARLFTIRRDGALLSAAVVLCAAGESHSYRVAWAPEGAEFGLGILQTTRVIEACAAAGDRIFDIGPGTEPYKAKWHPEVTTLTDIATTRDNWRTTAAIRWLRLRGRPSPW